MATMKELTANLKRGLKVIVRDTYSKADLHNKQVFVASHGMVECKKKKGHCAPDRKCVGKAVFVSNDDRSIETEGLTIGWRKGASKVCLTNILYDTKVSVLAVTVKEFKPTAEPAEAQVTEMVAYRGPVTWNELAYAAQAAEAGAKKAGFDAVRQLVLLARQLKTDDEIKTQRLMDAQERLLMIQDVALQAIGPLPEELPTDAEKAEIVPMGFAPRPIKDAE